MDYYRRSQMYKPKKISTFTARMNAAKARRNALNARLKNVQIVRGYRPMRPAAEGEQKSLTTGAAAYVCDTTGTITLVNGIAQGTTRVTRLAAQCHWTSVHVKGYIGNVDVTTGNNVSKIMLVWDKFPNGAATPAITDILESANALAFNNLDNRNRFTILMEESHALAQMDNTATQAVSGSPTIFKVDRYMKLPGLTTTFGGVGATQADIQQGALYLVTVGSNAVNTGGSFVGAVRLRFRE